jgi:hypothetical protein
MKSGLIAVLLLLPATIVAGSMTSEPRIGSVVDDAVSATIYGGDCQREDSVNCVTAGSCTATSMLILTGDGDRQPNTNSNCGVSSTCISVTKTTKKCEG